MKIDPIMPIGAVIKELRTRPGMRLTMQDLADKVGISKNHISVIESGKGNPSYQNLKNILFELGYEISIRKVKNQSKKDILNEMRKPD
jgi:transcriptional regulator with XRE-family HTH domain